MVWEFVLLHVLMDSSAVEGRRPRFLTKMVEASQSKARGPGGGAWRSETFRPGPRRQGPNPKLEEDGTKLQGSDQKRAISDPNLKVSDLKVEGGGSTTSQSGRRFVGVFFVVWPAPGARDSLPKGRPQKRTTKKTTGLPSGAQFFAPQLSGTT